MEKSKINKVLGLKFHNVSLLEMFCRGRHDSYKIDNKKWCSIHKKSSHNTKDCYQNNSKYKNNIQTKTFSSDCNDKDTRRNEELKIISEPVAVINTLEFSGKINEQPTKFILDSGASKNFLSKELALRFSLEVKEDKMVEVKFANNKTASSNFLTVVKVELDNLVKKKYVKLYVLEDGPDNIILGNEFLSRNEFILNYKSGIIEYKNRKLSLYHVKNNSVDHLSRCFTLRKAITTKEEFDLRIKEFIVFKKNENGDCEILKDEKQRIFVKENFEKTFIKYIHEVSEHCVLSKLFQKF